MNEKLILFEKDPLSSKTRIPTSFLLVESPVKLILL